MQLLRQWIWILKVVELLWKHTHNYLCGEHIFWAFLFMWFVRRSMGSLTSLGLVWAMDLDWVAKWMLREQQIEKAFMWIQVSKVRIFCVVEITISIRDLLRMSVCLSVFEPSTVTSLTVIASSPATSNHFTNDIKQLHSNWIYSNFTKPTFSPIHSIVRPNKNLAISQSNAPRLNSCFRPSTATDSGTQPRATKGQFHFMICIKSHTWSFQLK